MKEKRDRELLREALVQEIANNYEAIRYWIDRERTDFDWLKQNIYREIIFFAHEEAARNPGRLYCLADHGWFVAVFRELKKLCEQCQNADDKELIELLRKALGTIKSGDKSPETRVALRSKLREEYRANIQ